MTGKTAITIEFDQHALHSYTDEYLAMLWALAQHNPADGFATSEPGDLAERIAREIVRRWLGGVRPELWHHQGQHYFWHELSRIATYEPGGESGTPEWSRGKWVPKATAETVSDGMEAGR
ncbi:MAG TPA: hypothetical protein VMU94_11355 [Streptosporangiaceae bacterium]|nr:hypothetical protein [Streptosporangiaceae bacterium]